MSDIFSAKYKVIQKIGEGSFSDVIKCEDKSTGVMFAAKRLKKHFRNISDVVNCAEIKAMLKLNRHPNVLYINEYIYDHHTGKLIFIFELMDMSLYEFMKSKKRSITESRIKNFLYQILRGLEHLHRNGLFHRDIKPENILIKLLGTSLTTPFRHPKEIVKLADLGSVRGIFSAQPFTEYISTRWYRSPECLLTNGCYGSKMDIWATGCVFYEMLTFKPLFPGVNEIDQLARIHNILGTPSKRLLCKLKKDFRANFSFPKVVPQGLDKLLTNISEDGRTVMHLMIHYDPDLRSNVRRLIEHRYFNNLRDNDLMLICKNRGDYQSQFMHSNRSSGYSINSNFNIKTERNYIGEQKSSNISYNKYINTTPIEQQKPLAKSWLTNCDLTKYKDSNYLKPQRKFSKNVITKTSNLDKNNCKVNTASCKKKLKENNLKMCATDEKNYIVPKKFSAEHELKSNLGKSCITTCDLIKYKNLCTSTKKRNTALKNKDVICASKDNLYKMFNEIKKDVKIKNEEKKNGSKKTSSTSINPQKRWLTNCDLSKFKYSYEFPSQKTKYETKMHDRLIKSISTETDYILTNNKQSQTALRSKNVKLKSKNVKISAEDFSFIAKSMVKAERTVGKFKLPSINNCNSTKI